MWSLRRALLFAFLAVVSVPLAWMWLWPHSGALQNEVKQVQDKHLVLARNIAAGLDRYVRDLTTSFDYFAEQMLAGQPVVAVAPLLRSLNIRHICLIDVTSGRIITSVAGLEAAASGTVPPEALASLLKIAAERGSRPGAVAAGPTGLPSVSLVRRLGDRLVLGTIDSTRFGEMAGGVAFGAKGHAVIVDHTGRALAHPRQDWAHQMRDLSGVSIVQRMLRGESGVDTFHSPAVNEDMIAGFTSVPSTGWGVMVAQPMVELTAAADRLKRSTLSVFSMALILCALGALRFSMLVIRPLRVVMHGAERMAKNEKDVQVELSGRLVPREMLALARSFNGMARAVSQAQKLEADARARAERANRQKTEFVRYITHELRSPINAVLGFARSLANAMEKGADRRDASDHIKHIEDAGKHLLSLVNDLLDLGKMEAGQYHLNEVSLSLDEVIERCLGTTRALASSRDVVLKADYAGAPPEVRGDERALYQVLLNLVTNAIRYGRIGGQVEIRAVTAPSGSIEISVADNGPGIAEADLQRVMLPFERVERRGEGAAPGTGLGLPIVKRLVELHDGEFTLWSSLEKGTVAMIALPASRNLSLQPKPGPRKAA